MLAYHAVILLLNYRHEKLADLIEQTAEKSENLSTEAYKISKEAVKKQRNTTDELDKLKSEIGLMEGKINAIRAAAEDAQNSADQVTIQIIEFLLLIY